MHPLSPTKDPIAILVTLDAGYLRPLCVMLRSLAARTPGRDFRVFVLHSSLTPAHLDAVRRAVDGCRMTLEDIRVSGGGLDGAPTTDRYPREMYYRIFAAQVLPPELERILYLDPDVLAIRSVEELYAMPMGDAMFAACSHVHASLRKLNELRLGMKKDAPYINSGVMLFNLPRLRQEQRPETVQEWLTEHKSLFLPDQDVISSLYGDRILLLDALRYNLGEKFYHSCRLRPRSAGETRPDLDWVRQNTVLLHYCGRNKPWKPRYAGELGIFYREFLQELGDLPFPALIEHNP